MKEIFTTLLALMERGTNAVLVSIVASSGSVPRGTGAHMLVTDSGLVCGTIGGGAVEYKALEMAAQILEEKSFFVWMFTLRKKEVQDIGMICGGDVTVYFRYIGAGDKRVREIAEQTAVCDRAGKDCWLVWDITCDSLALFTKSGSRYGDEISPEILMRYKGGTGIIETESGRYFIEQAVQAGRVYIFGGGHVAQKLVPALSAIHFRCVVLEDREEFCKPELFPGVEEVRLISLEHIDEQVEITDCDYVCIMTRGHKDDMAVQAFAVRTPARYIGVIGSQRKAAAVRAALQKQGFTDSELGRVITPIGLDIGAETPEEIAVSIAAQLIGVRAGTFKLYYS